MVQEQGTTRRAFIKTAAAVAGATLVGKLTGCAAPGTARTSSKTYATRPKGDKLRVAFIGTGGIGVWHLEQTAKLDIVCPCYCDVDTTHFAKAAGLYPEARAYQDYREMFDREHKNFDAVMIGIPDHHHYPATLIAMQLGKHVYTQKPLTHTVWEARQLAIAARKYRVATQMGNQGHAKEGWRLVYEWIHSGAIGQVKEVHTWTDRPIWPQGIGRPEGEDPVPSNLNWDVWLGPAPYRPYKGPAPGEQNGPYHPFNWRGWWDFGCGALGDMACHTMDGLFAVLDPGLPTAVEPVAATPATDESFPVASVIKWEFPAKGWRPAFTAYWYDGQLKPRLPKELEYGRRLPNTGNLYIGTKGVLLVAGDYNDSPRLIPESKMEKVGKPKRLLERSPGHVLEWIMACRGEKPLDYPKSNFAYAAPFTEAVLLGNVALRVGRRIEYDARNLRITNLPEANQLLTKSYRKGWDVGPA